MNNFAQYSNNDFSKCRTAYLTTLILVVVFFGFSVKSCCCEDKSVTHAAESNVLAKVNGREITLDEFYKQYNKSWHSRMGMVAHGKGVSNPYTVNGASKRKYLDDLITKEVLYSEAVKRRLDKDEKFLTMVEGYKKRLLTELLLSNFESKINVTNEEIRDYYESNKDEFVESEKIRLQQIFVKTEETANQVKNELSKGADFGELAKKFSTDTFARLGGDLGFFPLKQMPKRNRNIVSKMKVGDVSKAMPVMGGGFRIVKLIEKLPLRQKKLDEVKETIRETLYKKKQKQALEDFVQGLKKSTEIVINYELLDNKLDTESENTNINTRP